MTTALSIALPARPTTRRAGRRSLCVQARQMRTIREKWGPARAPACAGTGSQAPPLADSGAVCCSRKPQRARGYVAEVTAVRASVCTPDLAPPLVLRPSVRAGQQRESQHLWWAPFASYKSC